MSENNGHGSPAPENEAEPRKPKTTNAILVQCKRDDKVDKIPRTVHWLIDTDKLRQLLAEAERVGIARESRVTANMSFTIEVIDCSQASKMDTEYTKSVVDNSKKILHVTTL